MGKITTTIALNDMVSGPLRNMNNALNMVVSSFQKLDTGSNINFDAIQNELAQCSAGLNQMNADAAKIPQTVNRSGSAFDGLKNKVLGLVGAYSGMKAVTSAAGLSDEITQASARLNMMNDGQQSTAELQQRIYQAAEASRGSYTAMTDTVAKLGILAKDAFSSNEEAVRFAELMNKQFVLGGASAQEQSAAMYQLTQAMAAGKLQGDEFRSIMENAPLLAQAIADTMGKSKAELKEMSAQGVITADVIKRAMYESAETIDKQFEEMPMTWGQVMTSIKNTAIMSFGPVLDQINDVANSANLNRVVQGVTGAMAAVAGAAVKIFSVIGQIAGVIVNNWSLIAPVIGVATAALVGYYTALGIYNGIQAVSNGIKALSVIWSIAHGAAVTQEAAATAGMTAAQLSFNAALLACPLTWILVGIIGIIAAVYLVVAAINKVKGTSYSATGVILGCLNVVKTGFMNAMNLIGNIITAIGMSMGAVASNIVTAFGNAIASVKSFFYSLLSAAANVIAGICAQLNKLPFVEFDYSGITSAADSYAAKAAAEKSYKKDYASVSDAFTKGMNTNKYSSLSDAYSKGYSKGSSIGKKISSSFKTGSAAANAQNAIAGAGNTGIGAGIGGGSAGTRAGNALNNIDKTTGSIKDSVQSTSEDLKLLRELAERQAINKFTTASIKVDMTGMTNQISGDRDIDGVINVFTKKIEAALIASAEGVHT